MSRIRAEPVHVMAQDFLTVHIRSSEFITHTPSRGRCDTDLPTLGSFLGHTDTNCSGAPRRTIKSLWIQSSHTIQNHQHGSKPCLNSHIVWPVLKSSQDLPSPITPHGKNGINCLLLKSSLYFSAYWRTGQEKEILKEYLHISISWSLRNITILSLHTAVDQRRQAQTQFLALSNISTEKAR